MSEAVKGTNEAIRDLQALQNGLRNSILRKAVSAGTKPFLKEEKAEVSEDTKTLRRALGRKVKTYRNSGVVVGIVGPRAGFAAEVTPRGRNKPVKRNPTKYAHLVERRSPFIAPAYDHAKAEAERLVGQTIGNELEKRT